MLDKIGLIGQLSILSHQLAVSYHMTATTWESWHLSFHRHMKPANHIVANAA